jgi:uncharacterized protein YkwD
MASSQAYFVLASALNYTVITAFVNGLRAQHGVPPLMLNATLSTAAGLWSCYLAGTGTFAHSFSPYGEDIAMSAAYRTDGEATTVALNAVRAFYAEIAFYDPARPFETAGHTTQLLWKSSARYGIGVAKNRRASFVTMMFDNLFQLGLKPQQ